jgi:YHS domain-containing protein
MILVEIAHPAGAFTEEDRDRVAGRVRDAFLAAGHAPEETMRRARAMTHIAFRELYGWQTGDGPLAPDTAPPVLVTVTVPEAWREETARFAIGALRSAVRRLDRSRGWVRRGGDLWVTVQGVPDGSIGLDGKASTADDVLAYMTEEFRAANAAGHAQPAPDGALVDPVCGMFVRPGRDAITLEHEGVTLGFCSLGCRDAHVRYSNGEGPLTSDEKRPLEHHDQ